MISSWLYFWQKKKPDLNLRFTLNRECSAPKPDSAGTIYLQNPCHAMISDRKLNRRSHG
ncbi:hypothetical protein H6F44_10305 [Pseudanabaena sp. FACHB-1277]|uniref:Uncharacterized protein n=1 Tax=Pseudanabaena cinerea FACHB-1277 TaxID=2949581 RepID=A0A926UTP9_9CYAN|nr:hypothetical protein [Pseudanabaena cinerea]MBD2150508.1 hypothetical protein [Pseudanabaena cinerea FACHB-1277]